MRQNYKHAASVSLAAMGAGFLATLPFAQAPYGVVLQSGFEAGLAGLADWFAVTALFRHPLGLPIPHTALLPRNREKVTAALVNAIQTNLLTKDSIIEKMRNVRLTERALLHLRERLDDRDVRRSVRVAAANFLSGADPAALARRAAPLAESWIRLADAGSGLRAACGFVLERNLEEPLFDALLEEAGRMAAMDETARKLGEAAARALEGVKPGGLIGLAYQAIAGYMTEERLGQFLQRFLISAVEDLRAPGHPYREAALGAVRSFLRDLPARPRALAEAEKLKERLLGGSAVVLALESLLKRGQTLLLAKLSDSDWFETQAVPYVRKLLDAWLQEPGKFAGLDRWLQEQAALLVERNHGEIGRLVKENADKLDNETLIAMMEKHVGKDLQWIRINGALCGFVIGIALGVFKLLV